MLLKAGLVRSSNARKKAPGSPNPFEALCERAFFFPLFFFFKTGGGSRSIIFPSIGTLPRTIHSLLTLGSGEPLQERAWRWRFAKEPAAREQKRHGLRLPPSNSATTTTPEEQSSRTSTPSLPPSSPRASPRAWRDASWKSELAARRSWRKQQSALKKERKMERGVKKKGRNQEAINRGDSSCSLSTPTILLLILFSLSSITRRHSLSPSQFFLFSPYRVWCSPYPLRQLDKTKQSKQNQ